jgi:hypothetical protein
LIAMPRGAAIGERGTRQLQRSLYAGRDAAGREHSAPLGARTAAEWRSARGGVDERSQDARRARSARALRREASRSGMATSPSMMPCNRLREPPVVNAFAEAVVAQRRLRGARPTGGTPAACSSAQRCCRTGSLFGRITPILQCNSNANMRETWPSHTVFDSRVRILSSQPSATHPLASTRGQTPRGSTATPTQQNTPMPVQIRRGPDR